MFERFTDDARRVIVLAQEEARTHGHGHVGTEHFLLGVTRLDSSEAAKVLDSLGVSLEQLRTAVGAAMPGSDAEPGGHLPFSGGAKAALESSLRESLQLSHDYIGAEHLLLGLFADADGIAARELVRLGTGATLVRQRLVERPAPDG